MLLKPQDILVLLKLAVSTKPMTYAALAYELGMSASEVHAGVNRARSAGLLSPESLQPNRTALIEFLSHGLRYVLPAQRGPITRGMPTAHAASPLKERISSPDALPPIWPDPEGPVRGETMEPIYKSVPQAARNDRALYECLALVDALRGGRARERKIAEELLQRRLSR